VPRVSEPDFLRGTVSRPERRGDRVYRESGPWTDAVHALLRHLHVVGFTGAPYPIGLDETGHEVLTYIEGQAAHMPWPRVLRTDAGLRELASLVRSFHDASQGFRPEATAVWRTGARGLVGSEVVIHGDLGPWNVVYRESRPVALIDWDLAEPGLPIHDLAHLAWTAIPLRTEPVWRAAGFGTEPLFEARLEAIADGYGQYSREELREGVIDFVARQRLRLPELASQGIEPWRRLVDAGAVQIIEAEFEYVVDRLNTR